MHLEEFLEAFSAAFFVCNELITVIRRNRLHWQWHCYDSWVEDLIGICEEVILPEELNREGLTWLA
jgi:hypothetical protein